MMVRCSWSMLTKPNVTHAMQSIDMIGLRIPRDLLERRIRITKEVANRPITLQGDAALLAGFMRTVTQIRPSTLSPAATANCREHMLDLVALTLGNFIGRAPHLRGWQC
jgi:hypothetical protein